MKDQTPGREFEELVRIMDALRENCPWDREQTHESLRRFLVEESAEALEALDNRDLAHLKEELGDLLLQIVFHARLGREAGAFDIGDVVRGINEKMVSRHPHVFGDSDVKSADEVLGQWERLKAAEKGPKETATALKPLPPALPALQQAQKVSEQAARLGFDWPDVEGVWDKVCEEIAEIETAAREGGAARVDEELGDLLFTMVNLARFYATDAEGALGRATVKFRLRFEAMMAELETAGRDLAAMTDAEKEEAWQKVKRSRA